MVMCAEDLNNGKNIYNQNSINLIILDLGLPDGNGIDFCKNIWRKSNIPIVIITVCDMETDKVSGLMAGADDYITKPFFLSVLRARVETVLRCADTNSYHDIWSNGYRLDTTLCKLFKGNEEILISATEIRILKYFKQNAG